MDVLVSNNDNIVSWCLFLGDLSWRVLHPAPSPETLEKLYVDVDLFSATFKCAESYNATESKLIRLEELCNDDIPLGLLREWIPKETSKEDASYFTSLNSSFLEISIKMLKEKSHGKTGFYI